jgi:hypothetical protein
MIANNLDRSPTHAIRIIVEDNLPIFRQACNEYNANAILHAHALLHDVCNHWAATPDDTWDFVIDCVEHADSNKMFDLNNMVGVMQTATNRQGKQND